MAKVHLDQFPWHMPLTAREIIANWSSKTKSPHSHSYYDQNESEIGWDRKPIGSLRISDHWNFHTRGDVHCRTTSKVMKDRWYMGRWNGEAYEIVETFGRRLLTQISDKSARNLPPHLKEQRKRDLAIRKARDEKLQNKSAVA